MVFFATVVRAVDHDAIQDYSNGVDELKIGITYERGEDYDQALKWYRLAADKGNAAAQKSLGYMYDAGLGVKQDYDQAEKWYRLAADQGNPTAQFNLGVMYSDGPGVTQDYAQAEKWYRLAADQGLAIAQARLGILYQEGGHGVTQNYDQALKWYRLAADQKFAPAQFGLGYMYDAGLGVKQDYDQAVKWYRLAADQGLELAKNSLRNIYNRFKSQPKLKNSESNYIIIKNNPDSNLLGKGFMKIAQMDYEGAINDFTKEIKLHPQSNYAFIYRGIAKTCINDYKSGRKDFVKASQISPEKAFSYNHLWESIIQTNPRGSFGEALLVQGADISYYTKLAIKVLDSLTGK